MRLAWGLHGRSLFTAHDLVQVLHGLQARDQVVVYSEREISASSRVQVVTSLVGRAP